MNNLIVIILIILLLLLHLFNDVLHEALLKLLSSLRLKWTSSTTEHFQRKEL